jgi:hypothetical protein
MKTRYRYIHFDKCGLALHPYYECRTNRENTLLGIVDKDKYGWEFQPLENTGFTIGCLRDIADFIEQVPKD